MTPSEAAPKNFSRHPLVLLSAVFAAGIAAASLIGINWKISIIGAAVLAVAALIAKRSSLATIFLGLAFLFLGAFSFQFENISIAENRVKRIYDESRIASGEPVEITGLVLAKPEPAYGGAFARMKVDGISHRKQRQDASGVVRLFVPLENPPAVSDFEALDLQSGSIVSVSCNLTRDDQYLNSGVTPRRQILDQQGIDATATVKSPLLIEKTGQAEWPSPMDFVYEQRRNAIEEFRALFSPPTAGVMIASLLGDKYFLDRGTAEIFREGGTFHVLVISGLHITFIGGMLLWIVTGFTRNRSLHFAIVGSILWTYAFAVGAEVPVVRAALMFTAFLFSRAIYRDGNLPNTLGLCCLILLVWCPSELFNPSFQLTLTSVAAIVAFAFPLIENLRAIGRWMPDSKQPFPPNVPTWLKRFCETLYWNEVSWAIERERQIWSASIFKEPFFASRLRNGARRITAYLFEGLLVSVIVQIWMLPLLVYYFHRVSPMSILLNLWVGMIIAIESFAAITALLFSQVSEYLAAPIVLLTEFLNWLLLVVPNAFANFDIASFRVPVYSGPMRSIYLVYFIPVVLLTLIVVRWNPFRFGKIDWLKNKSSLATLSLTALIASLASVMIFHPYSSPRTDGKLRVEFLDVGQGDSTFIIFPNGETMLIDGGGRVTYTKDKNDTDEFAPFEPDAPRIGEMVVSEFLWEKGYSHVDYVVATHADADHIQGLADVVRNFDVGVIYAGGTPGRNATVRERADANLRNESEMDELNAAAARKDLKLMLIKRGDVLEIGGVRIEILWPTNAFESLSDNNRSIVMRMTFGDHSFLFTGDIEREAEATLTNGETNLQADVVKVPHHGSRTSSTQAFVDAVQARTAVIPVGRRSMFGHPHREVLERWKAAGASIITTGERGAVSLVTDGTDLQIEAYLK